MAKTHRRAFHVSQAVSEQALRGAAINLEGIVRAEVELQFYREAERVVKKRWHRRFIGATLAELRPVTMADDFLQGLSRYAAIGHIEFTR